MTETTDPGRLEGGRGHARLQFSAAADVEPLWQRIADGTLRAVSIGYRVHRYDQRPDPVSGEMIYRAVDWEPFEISIVPIPVDRDAQVRGAAPQGAPCFAIEPALADEEPPMTETMPETPAAPPAPPAASPPATAQVETPPLAAPAWRGAGYALDCGAIRQHGRAEPPRYLGGDERAGGGCRHQPG
jgi:hypothetical protein